MGAPRDPSFTGIYAAKGVGKTTDALAISTEATAWVAAPGALSPAESVWGFPQPEANDLETFSDIRHFAEKLSKATTMLVVDDASLIADRTVNHYAAKGLGGFDLWAAVFRTAILLRDVLRRRGIHIVFTCHPAPAEVKNGVRLLGGPSFPGQVRTKLPPAFDMLLRAEGDSAGARFGWPMVYRVGPHPDWLQSSRYNTPDMAPMNLGEILRSAGFTMPRRRGLEWQEQVANAVANKLLEPGTLADREKTKPVLAYAHDFALKKFTKERKHASWAIRDGYDRAVLRLAASAAHASLWGF